MARVTAEDCLSQDIINRFELVVLAAERAKRIGSGSHITVDRDNDKDPVVALREIAKGNVLAQSLRDSLFSRIQKPHKIDDIESEDPEALAESEADFGYVADAGSDFFEDNDEFSLEEVGEIGFEDISEEDDKE
ncbi:MAG: DNA-directed RNA polymerase subunit omega [Rickettsiaceae bacterium]|nr:DNA-directed RNA polymerase subunit omega [Rickettsiaceae bacterium]